MSATPFGVAGGHAHRELNVDDVLFDVQEAPIDAVLKSGKHPERVRVRGKKALLHAESHAVLGVVSAGYRVVSNREALDLALAVCRQAFPCVAASEWIPTRVAAPRTLSYAAIDVNHRAHVLHLLGASGKAGDPYTPFVRVTNSFNGSRALRFDFGFLRRHCGNGVVFEEDVATVKLAHDRDALARLEVEVGAINLEQKWAQFSGFIGTVRRLEVSAADSHRTVTRLLRLPAVGDSAPTWRREEDAMLQEDITGRVSRYRQELGGNAYAVFNVVTDFAARPPNLRIFNKERGTLETRAGRWLRHIASASVASGFSWENHIAALGEIFSPAAHRPGLN